MTNLKNPAYFLDTVIIFFHNKNNNQRDPLRESCLQSVFEIWKYRRSNKMQTADGSKRADAFRLGIF